MKIGRGSRRLSLPLSRVRYAASGGSAPDNIRTHQLCKQAITWAISLGVDSALLNLVVASPDTYDETIRNCGLDSRQSGYGCGLHWLVRPPRP